MSDVYELNQKYSTSDNYRPGTPYDQKYVNSGGTVDSYELRTNGNTKINPRSQYRSVLDSSRLSRDDEGFLDKNIVYSEIMSTDLLGDFLTSTSQTNINSYNAILSLGSIITTDMYKTITVRDGPNTDLSQVDGATVRNTMVFRNYYKTGSSSTGSKDNIESIQEDSISGSDNVSAQARATVNLGLSLGEATVLNPMHQFNKRDDVRSSPMYANIGRVYAESVMSKWPVVLFQPGRLKYNNSFFNMIGFGGGAGATEALIRTGGEGLTGFFASIGAGVSDAFAVVGSIGSGIFGGNKMVEFKQNYNLFKKYVRFLYINLAGDMGLLQGEKYVGKYDELSLDNILPGKNLAGRGGTNWKNNQYLPFRCGKGITSSESFSNSMSSNPLAESMNATSEEEQEKSTGSAMSRFFSGTENLGSLASGMLKNMTKKVASNFSEQALILSGKSRIMLPDVWSNSSFSRSFGFNFKFHSPYGDDLSIFENCYIPFLTLLGMTLARQTGKMSYTSPFAVRVSVKNLIMINFGMIESLTVTRGGDVNDWTPNGYPKTLSVDISIKDMEPNIVLPLGSRGPLRAALEVMFPSSGISEYMASLGGLTLRDIHTIAGRWTRAKNVFLSTWNAKLDYDNMMSTIANTSMVSNITSLFSSTDLDSIHNYADSRLQEDNKASLYNNTFTYGNFVNTVVNHNGDYTNILEIDKDAAIEETNSIKTQLGG